RQSKLPELYGVQGMGRRQRKRRGRKQAPFAPVDHPAQANGERWNETFFRFQVSSFKFQVCDCDLKLENWNLKLLLEAIQGLSFVVIGVEHGQKFGNYQQVPNLVSKFQ